MAELVMSKRIDNMVSESIERLQVFCKNQPDLNLYCINGAYCLNCDKIIYTVDFTPVYVFAHENFFLKINGIAASGLSFCFFLNPDDGRSFKMFASRVRGVTKVNYHRP